MPDMFHLLYALSKSIGSAIARQQVQLQKTAKAYKKLKTLSSPAAISEVSAQITVLQAQQDKLEIDRQDYQQNLHALSQTIHSLTSTPGNQFGFSYPLGCSPFWLMWSGWVKPMPRLAAAIDVWTDTTPIRDTLVAVGTPSSLFPNPRPGYTTLGAHNSPALGLLASTNRKDTAPNSNRATTKPLNKRTLVFWHIVSLTPRH